MSYLSENYMNDEKTQQAVENKDVENVDSSNNENNAKKKKQSEPSILHWVPVIIAILYAVSPVNLVLRDVPLVDWFEDILFIIVGALHGVENNLLIGNESLKKTVGLIKWILLGIGVIVIIIMVSMFVGSDGTARL